MTGLFGSTARENKIRIVFVKFCKLKSQVF